MDAYKEVTRAGIRFATAKGSLSVEQLWHLSINELDALAVALKEEYEKSGKRSFVVKSTAKDKVVKLKFDVVLDILTTKVEEREAEQIVAENKAHNKKILELIAEKKDDKLKNMSISQLEAMLKD
jgi:hypothetical protein